MTFDARRYAPKSSGWLKVSARHTGRATLRFENPAGSVEGDAELSYGETGKVRIGVRLDPASLQEDEGKSGGLLPFIQSGKSFTAYGRKVTVRSFDDILNTCSHLTIETSEGTLTTTDIGDYSPDVVAGGDEDRITLTFEPSSVAFDVVGTKAPRYWVVPLLNFVSAFPQSSSSLDRHPLRLYPTPIVPENLPENERAVALEAADEKNELILFEFEGRQGFVERVPDYEERKNDLREGKTRTAATAVIVGEIGSRDPREMEDTFPSDVASLLSFATGVEVSAPSLEFRDEDGRLARRVHYRLNPAPYLEGHRLIRDALVPAGSGSLQATGLLLTQATSTSGSDLGKGYLRVAMRHLVRAGSDKRTIDEQMTYLCRCLDGLCRRFGVSQQKLSDSLTQRELDDVGRGLKAAKKAISPLADRAEADGRLEAARVLNRIAERASQASNIDKQFGLAVAELLKLPQIGLLDVDVADRYYAINPHPDGSNTWARVVSKYRGDVIHHGYFPFSEGNREVEDVVRVLMHLYDVTSRVIFRLLGYGGKYRPRGSSSTRRVDWVAATTPPADLGYG